MSAVVVPIVPAITIRRILYATDFSDASRAVLPVVAALAKRYRSEVYVANIRSPLPYTMATPEAVCVVENKREREVRQAMNDLIQRPELRGQAATAIVETGDPAEELNRAVRDYDIDLAVVGTHGRTGLMRLLMGSLAEELFRSLPCPVLTAGPRLAKRFSSPGEIRTILCPTDLSRESRNAFPLAASLAMEYKAKIVLLHVIPAHEARSSIARETAALARREVRRMFCPEIDPRCSFEVVVDFGDPAERILSCAREFQADVIALGVRPAGEGVTHFRNTVAYKVVLESECPVLTRRSA
ncbi:MAG TPA: universal stress protein [Candidatus Limnocylindrales bacterium]|nr:universal stress protein [Candidatus Limnocylindrales bacterium]